MIYYISDIHLDDQKIFDKCSRPFSGLKEYKEEIIRRWNGRCCRLRQSASAQRS